MSTRKGRAEKKNPGDTNGDPRRHGSCR